MRAHEAAGLVAAVVFAGSTTTWALASARPTADLPPAPGLSTGEPAANRSSTSTSSTSTPSTSDATTTEVPATQAVVTSEVTATGTEMDTGPAVPLPEPTSTWQPEPSGTYAPETPMWTPEVPVVEPSDPTTGQSGVADPGDDGASETDSTQGGGTDDGGATVGDDPTTETAPDDESPGGDLHDPLAPDADGHA